MGKISRDAEIIALAFFALGKVCKVTFGSTLKPGRRAQAALDELKLHGMIEEIDPYDLPKNTTGWKATAAIGRPIIEYKRPDTGEAFRLYEH